MMDWYTHGVARRLHRLTRGAGALILISVVQAASAQQPQPQPQQPQGQQRQPQRQAAPAPTTRAESLYVSNRHEDHPPRDFAADIADKARTDSTYRARSKGVMDFQKISYRSSVGDMDVPAYLFQPLTKRGAKGHAAMIWVHGGVHGSWGAGMFPFVKEAVERGYVIIAPEYRGSTGYGKEHYNAIDYGGYELDDVLSAVEYLKKLPHVDPDRLGVMGWSHGGFITAHLLFRDNHPFKAGAAIVPVTNLIFRLSYKGPGYQRSFSTQKRIGGLPFEKREIYVERSPLYHVDKLKVPLLVHVATNDDDVNFVEAEQMVNALRAKKPDLSETKIYVDPPRGHGFSRIVNRETLQRDDTPEQRDSWNRTWAFLEWSLRPYIDKSKPQATAASAERR